MDSRRIFIGKMTGGLAGSLNPSARGEGSGDSKVCFGLIGAGSRGQQLLREALASESAKCVAVADVYRARLEQAAQIAGPVRLCSGAEELLDVAEVEAVFIATPHHLHAAQGAAALQAGKHVYIERAAALTLDQAKTLRAAWSAARNLVLQAGHTLCSSALAADAARFLEAGWLGKITAIRAHHYRNTPHGRPQWRRPAYPDVSPRNVDWKAFLGAAPAHSFDAERFVSWRCYADYSGGLLHEGLSDQLAFWYKLLGLGIPRAVTMRGGVYLWDDGRDVPDTMTVVMEHPGDLVFSWDGGLGNNQLGTGEHTLGTDGSIWRGQQVRYYPQRVNRPGGREALGRSMTPPRAHVENFLKAIRGGAEANCPFETGYAVAVTCAMAIESWKRGGTVTWDPEREEIL